MAAKRKEVTFNPDDKISVKVPLPIDANISMVVSADYYDGKWYGGHLFIISGAAGGKRLIPSVEGDNGIGTKEKAIAAMLDAGEYWLWDQINARKKGKILERCKIALKALEEYRHTLLTINDGEIEGTIDTRPDNCETGIQESGETVEGEVLPPCKYGGAVANADEYAERFGFLHQASERLHGYSVLCATMAGAVMLMRKAEMPKGFTKWKDATAKSFGVSPRTADKYIALAKRCEQELKLLIKRNPESETVKQLMESFSHPGAKNPGGDLPALSMVELLAQMDPNDFDAAHDNAIAEAVKKVVPAETLQQLYFDWGISNKAPARRGGDMELQAWLKEHHPEMAGTKLDKLPEAIRAEFVAYRDGRKPTDEELISANREAARRYWERQRVTLSELGGGDDPTWRMLPDQDLLQTMVVLEKTAKEMKRILNERGAR